MATSPSRSTLTLTPVPAPQSGAVRDRQAVMRDRQARGKDPYGQDGGGGFSGPGPGSGAGAGPGGEGVVLGSGIPVEPFEDRERKGFALSVLDCPEQLMMYAQSRNDSIPAQRLHFTVMLCGFDDTAETKPAEGKPRKGGGGRAAAK
ncbi:hypothetical protein E4U41_005776 [Claviceps citrina]|nr:hypothetical protein E4U41_005776 [Claviceps citrina]